MLPPPPRSPLFPYTTLFRSQLQRGRPEPLQDPRVAAIEDGDHLVEVGLVLRVHRRVVDLPLGDGARVEDRKSTRLNSSHITISYAVFCLKKKNNNGLQCYQY